MGARDVVNTDDFNFLWDRQMKVVAEIDSQEGRSIVHADNGIHRMGSQMAVERCLVGGPARKACRSSSKIFWSEFGERRLALLMIWLGRPGSEEEDVLASCGFEPLEGIFDPAPLVEAD